MKKGVVAVIAIIVIAALGAAGGVLPVAYYPQEKMVRTYPVAPRPHGFFPCVFDDSVEFFRNVDFHKSRSVS